MTVVMATLSSTFTVLNIARLAADPFLSDWDWNYPLPGKQS